MLDGPDSQALDYANRVNSMHTESPQGTCVLPLETIPCPACGEQEEYKQVAKRRDGLAIVRCRCGLAFVNPRPTAEAIPEMYANYYCGGQGAATGYVAYAPTIQSLQTSYPWGWELIAKRATLRGARTLDIGCAYGKMVYWMHRAGARATGIDLLPDGVRWGHGHGLDLRVGTLDDLAGDEQFDVVTLMDVIEHIPDLSGFMAKLGKIMKPGGLVMVQTPNFGAYRGPRSIHLHTSLEHLLYFEAASLDGLLRRHGFEPVTPTSAYCVIPTELPEREISPPVSGLRAVMKRLPVFARLVQVKRRFFPLGNRYSEDATKTAGSTIVGIYRPTLPIAGGEV